MNATTTNDLPAIATNDYVELFLRHLVQCSPVMEKAKRFDLVGDDLMISPVIGDTVYKAFIDAAMSIGVSPIDPDTMMASLRKTSEQLDESLPMVIELSEFIYDRNCSLTPDYFLNTMKSFIRKRRWEKIQALHEDDPDALWAAWQPIARKLGGDDFTSQVTHIKPFETPLYTCHQNHIGTGIGPLDEVHCGLNLGEYGVIVGFSGGGKTAFGVNIALNNSLAGIPSQFISIEESEDEIAQRFYSNLFEISYTELHEGRANQALEECFKNPPNRQAIELLNQKLVITGMKGISGVTPGMIYESLIKNHEDTGYIPSVVIIDQMQFISPDGLTKKMEPWEKEKLLSNELDELSHKTIGGQRFCLWVLHQAKGNTKRRFKEEDVDGYKGIRQPTDLVIGIGRDPQPNDECTIFSLKARHRQEFEVDLQTELQYMRFLGNERN
jgi:hypothetical protein